MASALIHIAVAKKINDKLGLNTKELYLGAIAPDISKLVGQNKVTSHFLANEYETPNLDKFLSKYKNEISNPFILGYYIHLYTDKLWFDNFLNKLVSWTYVHLLDGTDIRLEKDELHELIYQDYTNLNISLIDKYKLDLSLFYEDVIIPKTSLNEIPIDKLKLVVDKMGIIIGNSTHDKNYIFDYSDIVNFIDESAEMIYKNVKNLLN